MLRSLFHRVAFACTSVLARATRLVPRRRRGVRSLWAGVPVLTMGINARAESCIVGRADSLVYERYFIARDFTYDLSRWARMPLLKYLLPYAVFVWAVFRYDRFHFYQDRGLLPPQQPFCFNRRELLLLRELGKEVCFWAYGADVRTAERTAALGRYHCCYECPAPGRACVCDERRGQANHEFLHRHATAIFSMGDMTEYTPGSVNDVFYWPVDLESENGERYAPRFPDLLSERPLRVVHAPNQREFKGTRFLIAAVDRLRAAGTPIELVLVERVPNRQALDIYREADLVFDQCLIGFHGYFLLEAMALGKPVMCYIRRPDYLLAPLECPIVNASPDDIERCLAELAADRPRLRELGEKGRAYVEKHYTPARFAERLAAAYRRLGMAVS